MPGRPANDYSLNQLISRDHVPTQLSQTVFFGENIIRSD